MPQASLDGKSAEGENDRLAAGEARQQHLEEVKRLNSESLAMQSEAALALQALSQQLEQEQASHAVSRLKGVGTKKGLERIILLFYQSYSHHASSEPKSSVLFTCPVFVIHIYIIHIYLGGTLSPKSDLARTGTSRLL